jgi:hypothetical protein
MTLQERLSNLERQVRNFKIATSGVHIEGGFGRLPKADKIPDRIANLERAASQFHLTGSDVEISGSFDQGYFIGLPKFEETVLQDTAIRPTADQEIQG